MTTRSGIAYAGGSDDAAPQPAFPNPLSPAPSQERHEEQASLTRDEDAPGSPFRADMTFTNENVASIIASLQKSQTEALRDLLLSVTRANSSTPVQPQDPGNGTLARCKAQFSGRPHESVEAFIDAVEAYSECAQVSSTNILRGLAYLFIDEAATWWQGIKNTVASWEQAKENLISAYGDRRPPHRIYLELFARPQLYDENTDNFVARSRALLSKLPERDITEKARLDMIYGLLHSKIRTRLRREEFESFQQLLRLARNIEDSQGESDLNKSTRDHRTAPRANVTYAVPRAPNSTAPPSVPRVSYQPLAINARQPPTAAATARPPAPPPQPRPPPRPSHDAAAAAPAARRQRPTCTYCRRFGHTRDQCRKLQNPGESQPFTNYSQSVRDNSDNTVRDKSEPFYILLICHNVIMDGIFKP
ncbi:hypothetical protein ABMA27_014473 [Loxostege sticticalis]|uniref:Gag protein n=1 Tax=Loxostege sticticalis TaxID=481309 RepID=A0ABR3I917_LOXSC